MIKNVPFKQYLLLEHDAVISCKYFVTLFDDFE